VYVYVVNLHAGLAPDQSNDYGVGVLMRLFYSLHIVPRSLVGMLKTRICSSMKPLQARSLHVGISSFQRSITWYVQLNMITGCLVRVLIALTVVAPVNRI
jgi:hypothetical protein